MAPPNNNLRLVAIVFAVVACAPALADGPPAGPPGVPYAPPECCIVREFNWTGIFIGGQFGGVAADVDWTTSPIEGFNHSQTSFGGGVVAAAQHQWGKLVA